jgi:hypothetical protein
MAELNIIERANKILTFRKYIREECRKKGLEYPSDEKIAEWINQEYGFNLEDFMKDYTEHQGIFRDPFNDFKAEVDKIGFDNKKPTEAEMREFFDENGNDIKGFIRKLNIEAYQGLVKETLVATLNLADMTLVGLWNAFIEESAKYGEDSYIYDICNQNDLNFINANFPKDKIAEVTRIVRNGKLHGKKVRFFQWFNLNDNQIHVIEDIKDTIIAYWDEIFERIMIYPNLYEIGEFDYFTTIFWGVCMKHLGYAYDEHSNELKTIQK